MSDLVRATRDGHVATVTLDRPDQRNAISIAMLKDMTSAFVELGADDAIRVVILAGEGEHFCAGADFSDLTIMQPPGQGYAASFEEAIAAITSCRVPVLAKVQGAALGAGCQVVVACDLAVAEEDARLGIPAAKLGLVINYENIQRLALTLGPKRTAEIMYTGRIVSGVEAAEWGLVNQVVPLRGLDARVAELAGDIAAGAPLTARASKRGIQTVLEHLSVDRDGDNAGVAAFDDIAAEAFTSNDLQEGVRAFKERREPRFEGR
ncbi:MAG: enoyl-CoA hydratase/isomerase family protein [Actinomycetota bacterium]